MQREGLKRALLESREPERRAPRPTLRSLHPFRIRAGDHGLPMQVQLEKESVDIIDLGSPGVLHVVNSQKRVRRYRYTPNPRLYPGPSPNVKKTNINSNSTGPQRGRRRKRVYRRPVPNSRLYRPAPARLPPPPASPSVSWPPPPAPTKPLETASHAALRLSERRVVWRPPTPPKRGKPSLASTRSQKPVPRSTAAKHYSRSPKRRTLRKVVPSRPPTANKPPVKREWSKVSSRLLSPDSQRLVVTLPAAGDALHTPLEAVTYRYRPASEHFRARELETDSSTSSPPACVPTAWASRGMDAPRYSTSPEDCSEGNDSAPSEFLAEFLSAIMQRQYAEALKYCRLILQFEPNNSTARGFYPLLQQKLAQGSPPARLAQARVARVVRPPRAARVRPSDSLLDVSSGSSGEENTDLSPQEVMEQEADSVATCSGSWSPCEAGAAAPGPRRSASSGSVASQSSLELDSSDAPAAHSSPDPSFELSRRTDRTDRTDSAGASGSGAGWESSGSAPASSACDDNGNPAPPAPPASPAPRRPRPSTDAYACDEENNERSPPPSPRSSFAARAVVLKSEDSSASLRRLRAQYTCSIK